MRIGVERQYVYGDAHPKKRKYFFGFSSATFSRHPKLASNVSAIASNRKPCVTKISAQTATTFVSMRAGSTTRIHERREQPI
jgi:hypothetical protein